MADKYLLESGTDGFLNEDGSGVLLLEVIVTDVFIEGLQRIEQGCKGITAAGLGGVIIE